MTRLEKIKAGDYDAYSLTAILSVSLLIFIVLTTQFIATWMTNDDIGMSMISLGYGITDEASPLLIYSNVLWGKFIQLLPDSPWVNAYSLATYLLLYAICVSFFHFLGKVNTPYYLGILIVLVLIIGPVLRPQFTVNAGLLTVAAIFYGLLYLRSNQNKYAVLFVLFAFLGFLIRKNEFILVLVVTAPLIPWHKIFSARKNIYIVLMLAIAIVASDQYNRSAFNGPEWQEYKAFEQVRTKFTDWNIHEKLILHKEDVLKRHGVDKLDLMLVSQWFFADSDIVNVDKLVAVVRESGSFEFSSISLERLSRIFITLFNVEILHLTIFALLLLYLYPSRRLFLAWFIFILAIEAIGILGRPGILRVYIPVLTLLALAPLFLNQGLSSLSKRGITITSSLMAAYVTFYLVNIKLNEIEVRVHQSVFKSLPNKRPIVAWGASLPYEHIYTVFNLPEQVVNKQIYALGARTFAPNTFTFKQKIYQDGFKNQITSQEGIVSYEISDYQAYLLKAYCKFKLNNKQLKQKKYNQEGAVHYYQYSCE